MVDVVWSGGDTAFSGSPPSILDVNAMDANGSGNGGGPAPFSKRSSANSLFATGNFATSGVQLLLNYANVGGVSGSGSGSGSDTAGWAGTGGSGSGGVSGGGGSSRRESLLSPSSSRRSKLSRTMNGKCILLN